MEVLNQYSGLFSLLAVIAAIIIPIAIYKKEKRDQRKAAQDELNSIKDNETFPMTTEDRNYNIRKSMLEKQAKRK